VVGLRAYMVVLGVAFVLAFASILYNYSTALRFMENYNAKAWLLAEEIAKSLEQGIMPELIGVRVRVTGSSMRSYGQCSHPLGYAYTFRIINNTLVKIEVFLCSEYKKGKTIKRF